MQFPVDPLVQTALTQGVLWAICGPAVQHRCPERFLVACRCAWLPGTAAGRCRVPFAVALQLLCSYQLLPTSPFPGQGLSPSTAWMELAMLRVLWLLGAQISSGCEGGGGMVTKACRNKGLGRRWVGVRWAVISSHISGTSDMNLGILNFLCWTWTHWEQVCAFFWPGTELEKLVFALVGWLVFFLNCFSSSKSLVRVGFVLNYLIKASPELLMN